MLPAHLYGLIRKFHLGERLDSSDIRSDSRVSKDYSKYGFRSLEDYRFPKIVNLCVVRGRCPCNCIHCPVGLTPVAERAQRFGDTTIRLELYKKVVDEISCHPSAVLRIHAVGEPLLWDSLIEALEISSRKNVKSWLFTCFVTNDKSVVEKLVEFCDIIEVSVNSRTSEDFLRTKGIDAFDLVEKNIELAWRKRTERGFKTRIIVSRVESSDPSEDAAFVHFWKGKGVDDAFVRTFHNYNDAIANLLHKEVRKSVRCLVHWNRFNVDCDGKVSICFNELFKGKEPPVEAIIGDLNNESIESLWHSERLNNIRLAQMKGNYGMDDFADRSPCRSCISCQPIEGDKPSSERQIALLKGGQIG